MFKRKKLYWQTPFKSVVLSDVPEQQRGQMFDGDAIANFITGHCRIPCTLVSFSVGSAFIQYHMDLANLMQENLLPKAAKALGMHLKCDVSYAKSSVANFSLIIPREERQIVHLKNVLYTNNFIDMPDFSLSTCLGEDMSGNSLCMDIAKAPHMIISGATGSGKSVLINSILTGIMHRTAPVRLQMVLIDAKQGVELSAYNGIPFLRTPVVSGVSGAVQELSSICRIMDERYKRMNQMGVKDISSTKFPRILIVIDELADLMIVSKKEVEQYIVRIAQIGRACGVHIIVATQQPRQEILTGLIRANIPCKISLKTASAIDSRISLGHNGAENLLGSGDALLVHPDNPGEFIRFQSAYVSTKDILAVCNYWKSKDSRVRI